MDCLWTVRSAHVEDAIGINVVGYSICGTLRGAGGMPSNWNLPRRLFSWSSPLALENLDERSWLVVRIGRQGLSLLGEDGGVMLDELGHHATNSLPNPWADESRPIAASPAIVKNPHL